MGVTALRFLESASTGNVYKRYQLIIDGEPSQICELSSKTVWQTVQFTSEPDCRWEIAPERKAFNKNWTVRDDQGTALGSVSTNADKGCTAFNAAGDQRFILFDPRKWHIKLSETALNSWPDRYVVASNDKEIGQIGRRLRDGEVEPQTRLQKFKSLVKPRDWTVEFAPQLDQSDLPLMTAAILILLEVIHRGARSV